MNAEQDTHVLRYTYTSFTVPASTYEVDMRTGERTLLKRRPVLAVTRARTTPASASGPRHGTACGSPSPWCTGKASSKDGRAPLYQYAYGAYGATNDPSFDSTVISLLDRGFVYAIAHIRGGQELGRAWYDDGRRPLDGRGAEDQHGGGSRRPLRASRA